MLRPSGVIARCCYQIAGKVQGVGFRPFVFRLAHQFKLIGFVRNSGSLVSIEVQGQRTALEKFNCELRFCKPTSVSYTQFSRIEIPLRGESGFQILTSDSEQQFFEIPSDLSTCQECLTEMRDPNNRRYAYPFVHCSACGPRWSILDSLPFDRERTSLKDFPLCEVCKQEYGDPLNRRFHAQTLSCADCGPQVSLCVLEGEQRKHREASFLILLQEAVARLKAGQIAAVKGVGGYQLWALAQNAKVVAELRRRKNRPQKPFALMVSSLAMAEQLCEINTAEKEALLAPSSPIVLLRRRGIASPLAQEVAMESLDLGIMLPASPLQSMLMDALGVPVVATSGNISEERIIFEEQDAFDRLASIADFFITHNRRILRPLDDSVVRVVRGKLQVLRLARGLAPQCFEVGSQWGPEGRDQIALGADLKSALAVRKKGKLLLSETFGSLSSHEGTQSFTDSITDYRSILGLSNELDWATDLHPSYRSSQLAPMSARRVQHHLAHALSCIFEHGLDFPVLAAIWDGTGYGLDGTLWGGEFLRISGPRSWERLGHLLTMPLLGGEAAIRDPRRGAFALLWRAGLTADCKYFGFSENEIFNWSRIAQSGERLAAWSSGMGRLFDGVSALMDCFEGKYEVAQYEGQAAMKLEMRALRGRPSVDLCAQQAPEVRNVYAIDFEPSDNLSSPNASSLCQILDWRPLVKELVQDIKRGVNLDGIAGKFHSSLISLLTRFFEQNSKKDDPNRIVLAGGCFQNQILLEESCEALGKKGFEVYWPQRIPTHDGGIAVGQIIACSQASRLEGNI